MKKLLLFVAAAAGLAMSARSPDAESAPAGSGPTVPAQAPARSPTGQIAAPADSPADRNFRAVQAIFSERPADPKLNQTDPRKYVLWADAHYQKFAEASRAFFAQYPNDPRRWEAVIQSGYTRPLYVTGFKPTFDSHPSFGALIEDEASVTAFKTTQEAYCRAAVGSADATEREKIGAYGWLITKARETFIAEKSPGNRAAYMALVDQLITKFPASASMVSRDHLMFLAAFGTEEERSLFAAKIRAARADVTSASH